VQTLLIDIANNDGGWTSNLERSTGTCTSADSLHIFCSRLKHSIMQRSYC